VRPQQLPCQQVVSKSTAWWSVSDEDMRQTQSQPLMSLPGDISQYSMQEFQHQVGTDELCCTTMPSIHSLHSQAVSFQVEGQRQVTQAAGNSVMQGPAVTEGQQGQGQGWRLSPTKWLPWPHEVTASRSYFGHVRLDPVHAA
jgi:hypothetical protein